MTGHLQVYTLIACPKAAVPTRMVETGVRPAPITARAVTFIMNYRPEPSF
jgi:hypothetical protein